MSNAINGSTPQNYGNYRLQQPQVAKPATPGPSELMQAIAASRNAAAVTATPQTVTGQQQRFTPKAQQAEGQAPLSPQLREANQGLLEHRLQRLNISEIQAIAQKAGYVDVSAQAIQRAFIQKESLLVDYKA
jgi:hypothetical protein